MVTGRRLENLPSWDELPGLVERFGVDELDLPGEIYNGVLKCGFPSEGIDDCIYGENIAELLAIRAAAKGGFQNVESRERKGVRLSQEVNWAANFFPTPAYLPLAVSDGLAVSISLANPGKRVLTLPNVIATDIYSRTPEEPGVLRHHQSFEEIATKRGLSAPSFRELFGLRDNSQVVITHGRMEGSFPKTHGLAKVIDAYEELGEDAGNLDYLCFGTRPNMETAERLRARGSRVVFLLDTAKLTLPETKRTNERMIRANSRARILEGDYSPIEPNQNEIFSFPFGLGKVAEGLGAVGYFLRPTPGAFELSYGEMSSGFPVVTAVNATSGKDGSGEKYYFTDGQMGLVFPEERLNTPVTYCLEPGEWKAGVPESPGFFTRDALAISPELAKALALQMKRFFEMSPAERDAHVRSSAEWIGSEFGYEAFSGRLGRLMHLNYSGELNTNHTAPPVTPETIQLYG
ncbi:MAG: hypothetical protein V1820_05740 [archaeon]